MAPSSTRRIFLVSVTVCLMFISINGQCIINMDCLNGGSCNGNQLCNCAPSWSGPTCESPVGPCAGNECANGAICQPDGTDYICDCRPAHKGIYCEYLADFTSCSSNPCVSGECADVGDGNVFCDCTPFTNGAFCERTPPCTDRDPCLHNGQCVNGTRNDDPSSCMCNSDWTGDICEFPLTCKSNTCRNGGTCTDFGDSANCDCTDQWEGPTCEDAITTCNTVGCANGGTCANGICECTEFYTGEFCEDNTNNTCGFDYCFNGGTCTDSGTTAYCICPQDFTGEYCETDINNMCGSDVCYNGGTCIDAGSFSYCNCPEGFSGDFCETDINNMCGSDFCYNGGTCIDAGSFSYCNCPEGFSGDFCETDIGMCSSGVCQNGGTCIDSGTTAYCMCPQDFTGGFCETVSACFNEPCENGGTCVDTSSPTSAPTSTPDPGSYFCECPSGYSGANCGMITPCIPNPCFNNGVCSVQNGMSTCECTSGFQGPTCMDTQPNPPMNNGLSQETIGIIAGSAAAVVIVIVIIIAIACYCCRKKRDDDKDRLTGLEMGANQRRGRPHDYLPSPTRTLMPAIPNLRVSSMRDETKMEFPRNRLTLLSKIGSGSFADVYKAEAVGIIMKEKKTIVAVKRLKETATENDKSDLSKEISLFMYLDPHPNIVNILGCCTDVDPWYIVMEYLPNGNLQGYLRQIRTGESMTTEYKNVKKQKDIPPNDLLNFGVQIARGMEYLASRACIHRDLAARNILLGEGWVCKVSDFGLARDLEDGQTYEMKSQGRVPVRWMSPESLLHNTYTSQSDVWSFAILIWEIVTLGSHPYPGMSSKQVVKEISAGYRLPKPEHCSQDIYNLMKECWAYEAEERPTFSQVKVRLENMLADAQGYLVMSDFNDDNYLYLEPDAHTGDTLDNEGFSHLE